MHADQNGTGYLGRPEFYNALKLVTVAQSGRELTPEIVRAALFGAAASRIPAPQIAAMPAAAAPTPVVNSTGIRAPQLQSNMGSAQQFAPPTSNQFLRPMSPQTMPTTTPLSGASMGPPGAGPTGQRPQTSVGSTEWPGSRIGGQNSVAPISRATSVPNFPIRGSAPLTLKQDNFGQPSSTLPGGLMPPVQPKPLQENVRPGFSVGQSVGKVTSVGGNGFSSDSVFGSDVFSATPQPKQVGTSQNLFPVNNSSSSMALVPSAPTPMSQSSYSGNNFAASTALVPTSTAPTSVPVRPDKMQNTSVVPSSVGAAAPGVGGITQLPWPRMTESDVKKYTKVFSEVDTDRDGKITGEQARDLFLSWRLPRGIYEKEIRQYYRAYLFNYLNSYPSCGIKLSFCA